MGRDEEEEVVSGRGRQQHDAATDPNTARPVL